MTHIKLFRTSRVIIWILIVIGGVSVILGLLLLLRALHMGFDTHFPSGDWNSVTFILQGILLITMGGNQVTTGKYYIEWDENALTLMLPGTKEPETIKIDDINSVDIELFTVRLNIEGRWRTIDLQNLRFEDLKKVKERFKAFGQV